MNSVISVYPKIVETEFLVKDDFLLPVDAGSIGGTLSTPGGVGPNTRTVIDTEGKISLASGLAVLSGGKAVSAWNDPVIYYGAIARVAGRIFLTTSITENTTTIQLFGLRKDPTVTGLMMGLSGANARLSAGIFQLFSNAWGSGSVPFLVSVTYTIALVLRSSGFFYFVKGGVYTSWTLIWVEVLDSTTPLYPYIGSYSAAYSSGYVRVPRSLWLPIPLASDSFNRGNGALGSTDGAGHAEANGGSGLAWTGSTWTISTNAAINTPTVNGTLDSGALVVSSWYKIVATEADHFYVGCAADDVFVATATTALDASNTVKLLTLSELFATLPASKADVIADISPTITGNIQGGIVVNLDSASSPANFIIAYYNKQSGKACLDEYVAGVRTSKIATTTAYSAGAVLRVVRYGTSCDLYYNNAKVSTTQTMTANTNAIHGVFAVGAGVSLDAYTEWPRGTGGEYSRLDEFIR